MSKIVNFYFKCCTNVKNFFSNIYNIIRWIPTLWKDRNWDYGFMLELERKKLQQTIKWYEKNDYGVCTNGRRYCNQMRIALNCLNIILDDDWWSINIQNDIPITEWLKRPCSDNDYVIKAYVNLNNWKRFMPRLSEKSIKEHPNLWKTEIRTEKAWHLYHKLREHCMQNWWD